MCDMGGSILEIELLQNKGVEMQKEHGVSQWNLWTWYYCSDEKLGVVNILNNLWKQLWINISD